MVAQGKSGIAHKGMVHVAQVMAATGAALIAEPVLLEAAQAEFAARLAQTPYLCPMPAEAVPPVATPA